MGDDTNVSIETPFTLHKTTYLFLQCQAQTIIRMRAVRTMTSTGTRTAASATSKRRKRQSKHWMTNVSTMGSNELL